MSLEIDHIVVCVPYLNDAPRQFEAEHGVHSIAGGRHAGHGTANRVVPLGGNYVELLAVVDAEEAVESPLGTWVSNRAMIPGADGLCLRTDDLDEVCQRLDLIPTSMSRVTPEGKSLKWRMAGLESAISGMLPFFVQWEVPDVMHPGQIRIDHPEGKLTRADVTVFGDRDLLERCIDGAHQVTLARREPQITCRIAPAI